MCVTPLSIQERHRDRTQAESKSALFATDEVDQNMQPDMGNDRFAIPAGRWFGVEVQVSLALPLMLLPLTFWLGVPLGVVTALLLLVTIVIHEFAHVFMARATGGAGDRILLWPLGGLAYVEPGRSFRSRFLVPAAGPLTHVVICLLLLPVAILSKKLGASLHPIQLPIAELGANIPLDIGLVMFSLNWKLLLINLVPAYPLDGGQMTCVLLARRHGLRIATHYALRVSLVTGLLMALAGLMLAGGEYETAALSLVMLGGFIAHMNHISMLLERFRQEFEGSYMGYGDGELDFGQNEIEDDEPQPGLIERWKQRREEERLAQEEQERRETIRRVDELLEKISREGMSALTEHERKFLSEASPKYRHKDTEHS
ncbi:MAG: DUF6576 domain-containing protein [Planctomycetaceae bacterium]